MISIPTDHRKLAAIMFTDMVGYSALAQKNESLALALLEEHRQVLRPIFSKYSGKEIETIGDAFFVEFSSALQSSQCAIEIQTYLHERNNSQPDERKIQLRIGLHLGDVVHMGKNVHGDGVNIAARVEPLAKPGGICITEDVAHQIQNKIDLPVMRLGKGELKNIQVPVNIYRILMPWEKKQLPFSDRLSFTLKKRKARLYILAALVVAVLVIFVALFSSKTTSIERNSIAVLPFTNMSEGKETEYFSDGITAEIIAQISKIGKLRVIGRTSVMQYKNTDKSPREIGRDLNVATILEGSIRRSNSKIRIEAGLIDASNGVRLWGDIYDKEFTQIFNIQSDVAHNIASELNAKISPSEQGRLEKKETDNFEAYDLYLRGRYYWNERTQEGAKISIGYYRQAIEKDSLFALAHAGLADSYAILGNFNYVPPKEAFPIAKAEALKALGLDSTLAEAHAALGLVILYYDWNWHLAEEHFKRAIELNPSYASAHQWYSTLLILTGRIEESLVEVEQAEKLDPLSPIIHTDKGEKLYYARRYDEAIEQYQKTLVLFPGFFQAHYCYGLTLLQRSKYNDAVASLIKARDLSVSHPGIVAMLGYAYARSGNQRAASQILDELEKKSKQEYISPYFFAIIYTGLGQKDLAIKSLEAALNDHSNWMIYLRVQPIFDSLRSDPRFGALLKKLDLASGT